MKTVWVEATYQQTCMYCLSKIKMESYKYYKDSQKIVLLEGTIIDFSLKFDNHVKMICKKASQKLTSISRMAHYLCHR